MMTSTELVDGLNAYDAWAKINLPIADVPWREPDGIVIRLSREDYRFITEFDPERERSVGRAGMVSVLEEIQAIVRGGRGD